MWLKLESAALAAGDGLGRGVGNENPEDLLQIRDLKGNFILPTGTKEGANKKENEVDNITCNVTYSGILT